ncbi:MAG: peptidase M49 [Gammaproteobacteria bacterium]|nr:peptidase M49 [Gammaproteobacteria bacterium]
MRHFNTLALTLALAACGSPDQPVGEPTATATTPAPEPRKYLLERVGDAAVVQLYADGFNDLSLKDKVLAWHLYQAAIAGRDIYWDQRYEHGLAMRQVVEEILTHAAGIEPATLAEITRYTKLLWINNGPYGHITTRKFVLGCTPGAFAAAAAQAAKNGASFPLAAGESLDGMLARMQPLFFDASYQPQVTQKTPEGGKDILQGSANNLYSGVSLADLQGFTEKYALNSRLVKADGKLVEEVYRVGGRYDTQIRAIIGHLEAAREFAPPTMQEALAKLIRWYQTGEDADREAYDIAWVADKDSPVDTVNGFIEVYLDARGVKGSWEGIVSYVNGPKTRGIEKLAADAQWFEDHMPWAPEFRKAGVRGITARAIDVVIEAGDAGPMTPIGINLPNDQSVREQHGSKSVLLSNVVEAYDKAEMPEFRREFAWSPAEVARSEKWSSVAEDLHTNMHEVIGHASGKVSAALGGKPAVALKEQYSALEEARADLVALYFLPDPRLAELGLLAAKDQAEITRQAYESYARGVLVQLRQMREGTRIEEDHMRNRQMIVNWLIANTKAIEVKRRDGKTYYVMTDPAAFREGVGRLLAEVQRIKSTGDYPAAKALFETHGIHFDPALRDEVVARVDRLDLPSYTGFVMPKLTAVTGPDGGITDVTISYPQDLTTQMLEFSRAGAGL